MKEDRLYIIQHADLNNAAPLREIDFWHELHADWYGKKLPYRVFYALEADEHAFRFSAKCLKNPDCDETICAGKFVEGLWQRDVAELFLLDDRLPSYQEFNLSPTGAWWSASFSGYRNQDSMVVEQDKVQTDIYRENMMWSASILVPRSTLLVDCALSTSSRANVCFIYGNDESRTYISAGRPEEGEPDYHNAQIFPTITNNP